MRVMKRWLTWSALAALSAISVVGAAQAVRSELRRPPAYDREMLAAYLTGDHEADAGPGERRRAARRLELDFHEAYDRQPAYDALDREGRARFERNVQRLLAALVAQQAELYALAPRHRRQAFLDARLGELRQWYAFVDGKRLDGAGLVRQPWLAKEPPGQPFAAEATQRTREYAAALQARAIQRIFDRVLPTAPPPRDD